MHYQSIEFIFSSWVIIFGNPFGYRNDIALKIGQNVQDYSKHFKFYSRYKIFHRFVNS